jgi:hypothetical protein
MRQTGRMEYKGDTYYIDEVLNGKQNAFTWLVNMHTILPLKYAEIMKRRKKLHRMPL